MTRRPWDLYANALGTLLLLVGALLPWLRGPHDIWGWDISVFWPVTGDLGALHLPPSLGAVVFLVALALAVAMLRGRPLSGPVAAGLAGLVVAVTGLSVLRALTFPQPVPLHVGIYVTAAGAVIVAAAALLEGDEVQGSAPSRV